MDSRVNLPSTRDGMEATRVSDLALSFVSSDFGAVPQADSSMTAETTVDGARFDRRVGALRAVNLRLN